MGKKRKKQLKSTVADAVEDDGVCYVPINKDRLVALAGAGQDIEGFKGLIEDDGEVEIRAGTSCKRKDKSV